ncbi:MAG: TldD/PmbA family protein [Candidatus Cloacimonetes bacterium]|nr:TldD/PmbA family protein [Candidatus Cloacimonadota bacterium]
MNTKIAQKLLEFAKRKTKKAEVSYSSGQARAVSFGDSKFKTIETSFSAVVSLRIIKDGRVGVAATNKMENIENLVDKAIAVSRYGPQARFEFPPKTEFSEPKTFDLKTISIPGQKFIDLGASIIDDFKKFNPKILTNLDFAVGEGRGVLINTSGLQVETQGSKMKFFGVWDKVSQDDMLQIGEGQSSPRDDIAIPFYLERAKEKLRKAERIAKIKSGCYPLLFTPDSIGSILDYIFTALNGKVVVKKSSRLQDKLGEKVFAEKLTIVDDGTLNWKMGSGKCDSEGVAVSPLTLIENGVVRNFYYDLQSAAQAGTRGTGHGERGAAAALAHPSLHNLIIKEGKETYVSILKSIKEGILAEDFLGAGQDNPYNGDFSMNLALGFKIENGEIVGRVKDTMIAGNAFDILRNGLLSLSSEREWVGNSFYSPYFLLDGITVASRS